MCDPKPIRATVDESGNGIGEGIEDSTALTLLWGTWELWADVSPAALHTTATTPHHGSHSSSTAHHTNVNSNNNTNNTTALASPSGGALDSSSVPSSSVSPAAPHTDGAPPPPLGTRSASPGTAMEKENWLDQVKSVGLLDSVEGFWGVYDCVLLPSQLPPNSSYYLFRKHIAPMWEHEANRRGGKWVISFSPHFPQVAPPAPGGEEPDGETPMAPVDIAWQKLCLACIGELLPGTEEEICGVTVTRGKVRPTAAGSSGAGSAGAGNQTSTSSSSMGGPAGSNPSAGGAPSSANSGEWKLCLWTRNAEDSAVQMQIAHFIKDLLELNFSSSNGSTPKGTKRMEKNGPPGKNKNTPFRRNEADLPAPNSPSSSGGRSAGRLTEETAHGGGTPLLPAKPLLVYMAHRDLMQAKQNYAKAGGTVMGPPLKPRYSL